MPNVAELQKQAQKLLDREGKKVDAEAQMLKLSKDIRDFSRMKGMFEQEEWKLLQNLFQKQKDVTVELLASGDPMTDVELQVLRNELVCLERILNVDEWVANSLKSRMQKLKALSDKPTEE